MKKYYNDYFKSVAIKIIASHYASMQKWTIIHCSFAHTAHTASYFYGIYKKNKYTFFFLYNHVFVERITTYKIVYWLTSAIS